jgi:hypothetical protein
MWLRQGRSKPGQRGTLTFLRVSRIRWSRCGVGRALSVLGPDADDPRIAERAQAAGLAPAPLSPWITAHRYPLSGAGTLQELPGLDHCWTRHETRAKSLGNCGKGTKVSTLGDAMLAFLTSTN